MFTPYQQVLLEALEFKDGLVHLDQMDLPDSLDQEEQLAALDLLVLQVRTVNFSFPFAIPIV